MELSIIIISYKRNNDLEKCIRSCASHTTLDYEIVVVDNDSNKQTESLVDSLRNELENDLKYVAAERNLGVAGGRNLGFSIAKSNACYFIDDDAIVTGEPDVIDKMVSYMESNQEIGALGTRCNDSVRGLLVGRPIKGGMHEENCQIISFVGGSHLIFKDRYPYNQLYPGKLMYGAEERFAGLAIYQTGKKCFHYNQLTIEHHPSPLGRDRLENNKLSSYVNEEIIKGLFLPGGFKFFSKVIFIGRYIKYGIKWKVNWVSHIKKIKQLYNDRKISDVKNTKLTSKQVLQLIKEYGWRRAL